MTWLGYTLQSRNAATACLTWLPFWFSIAPICSRCDRSTETGVASQFVITFQFVINYYKLERICNTIASQFVINYYKLERICTAAASQFVINYYKLARICNVFAFQFVIKYYILDDTQSTLENKGERSLPLSSRYRVNVGFDILIIHIIKLT